MPRQLPTIIQFLFQIKPNSPLEVTEYIYEVKLATTVRQDVLLASSMNSVLVVHVGLFSEVCGCVKEHKQELCLAPKRLYTFVLEWLILGCSLLFQIIGKKF